MHPFTPLPKYLPQRHPKGCGVQPHVDRPLPPSSPCSHSPLPTPALPTTPGPVGATAAAAAIKWIVKDGIGAAGRLLVGGRLGLEFDDDPRRWRMAAEALTTLGEQAGG
jgi:hypothetical protein